MPTARRGFTLIELLVVVAIIALLIAILLPSLGRAKASAVRVQCASILRQWGTVINIYSQENNNWFFARISTLSPTTGNAGNFFWNDGANSPYLTEWNQKYIKQLRTCPGDPTNVGNGTVSYAMVRYAPLTPNVLFWKITEFNHPTSTTLMADTDVAANPYFSSMADPVMANEQAILQKRHMGIGNVMFLDTHVEAHNYQDLTANIPSTLTGLAVPPAEVGKVWTSQNR